MADYEDSLMVQSERRNKNLLFSTANSLRQRRNAGDNTDYERKNKNKGKAFSLRRFIQKKLDKTGRFGGRKAKDRNDDTLAENAELEEENAKQVQDDFVVRADDEIQRSIDNDFERERIGEDESLEQRVQKRAKRIMDTYRSKIVDTDVYKMMFTTGDTLSHDTETNFENYVYRILTDEEKINARYPITNLKEDRLAMALKNRESAKQVIFGANSLEEALETAFNPQHQRSLYCILTASNKSDKDLLNLKQEAAKKQRERLENEEKERKKAQAEKPEMERLEAKRRKEEENAKEKEGKQGELAQDINPEGIAVGMQEKKRVQPAEAVSAPPKMTKKLIKGMLADLNKFGLDVTTFVSVFKTFAGIEGRSTISGKMIDDYTHLVDFLYACSKNSGVGTTFPKLYADIMNAKTNVDQYEKYTELLRTITANYSRETLKSMFAQFYIY